MARAARARFFEEICSPIALLRAEAASRRDENANQ